MGVIAWWFWIGGGALVAAGAAAALWALLGDRLRAGRRQRRCPRCWYDMNGVPGLTCPECGRDARDERRLHRTRRRWGRAAAASVLLLIGVGLAATPAVRARGWTALVPTTAFIYMLPWIDGAPRWYSEVMHERTGTAPIPRWQRRLLFSRCDVVLTSSADRATKLRALRLIESIAFRGGYYGGPTGEAGDAAPVVIRAMSLPDPSVRGFAAAILPTVGGDPEGAVAALAAMAGGDPDGGVRRRAVGSLYQLREHAAVAAPAIIAATRFEGTPYLQRDALGVLGHLGPSAAPEVVPVLIEAAASESEELRLAATESLGKLGPSGAAGVPALIERLGDPYFVVQREAATALAKIGVKNGAVLSALLAAMSDPNDQVSASAFTALAALGEGDAALIEPLRERLGAADRVEAANMVSWLAAQQRDITPFARWLVPRLEPAVTRHWSERMEAAKLLCECGYRGEEALGPARALLTSTADNDRVRVWAHLLVAQLEGDRAAATPAIIGIIRTYQPPNGSNVWGDAAEALAIVGPGAAAALPLLEEMLDEEAWAPREHAKRAIHAITGEPLTGRLAPTPTGGPD